MHDLFDESLGVWQPLDLQWQDFEDNFWKVTNPGFWKLERRQSFSEPHDASWQAFTQGNWDEAMRLLDSQRNEIAAYQKRIADKGITTQRIRIIEKPFHPYLHWELRALLMYVEFGSQIRVVPAEQVREFEKVGPLPEIYTLDTEIMYQAEYDDDGNFIGAYKFVDPELISRCRDFMENLYGTGEDLRSFFAREIAALDPPGRN